MTAREPIDARATPPADGAADDDADEGLSLLDIAAELLENAGVIVGGALGVGVLALGATFLVTPTFTARTSFLPPQQQQSAAAGALASLGALSGLAGAAINLKSPADQYVALMQSDNVADRIIDGFDLQRVYDLRFRADTRKALAENVRIGIGKKDGLVSVEVDDAQPQRAAEIANRYVAELRRLSSELAITEAQQRRVFFEQQLKDTREQLVAAQRALEASGFSGSALRAEPKAAAEGYARLQAELTAAEVRLQGLRRTLVDNAPEVQQQLGVVAALREQLARLRTPADAAGAPDYIGKYREFKYREALFEVFSRQYELARLDESREGALIQVVDPAVAPEKKSKPRRASVALTATFAAFAVLAALTLARNAWRRSLADPRAAERAQRLRRALRRR